MKKTSIFLISGAICASMFLPTLKSISALAESVSNINFKNFILNDTKEFADDFNRKSWIMLKIKKI